MKSTKKIIIGLIAVIALLITIAGALAVPPTTTYSPNGNSVTVLKNQTQPFNVAIANNTNAVNLTYTWSVDNIVKKTESSTTQDYTSVFDLNGNDYTTGIHAVLVTVTGSDLYFFKTWTVTVQEPPQPEESALTVTKVKVNGKTNGKLSVSKLNEIEVEVSNEHDQKIKDITVTLRLLDEDGDEIVDDEDEISKLSAGDEDTVTFEFDLSDEDLEEEEYTLEIEVEGEDSDGDEHSDLEEIEDVEVDREKDDLVITKAELEDSQVFCSANPQTSLKVEVKNIGENEQDGAKITVKNSELDMNLQRANIDLDDYSGSDNEYEATFALNLEGAKQGTYTLDIAVHSEDNDLMDSEEVELQVVCATGASQEETSTEYYADKELAAELQKKIDEYKAVQESQAAQRNFRESSSYVLLLGILVAMMFFAAILSATYVLLKRK